LAVEMAPKLPAKAGGSIRPAIRPADGGPKGRWSSNEGAKGLPSSHSPWAKCHLSPNLHPSP